LRNRQQGRLEVADNKGLDGEREPTAWVLGKWPGGNGRAKTKRPKKKTTSYAQKGIKVERTG